MGMGEIRQGCLICHVAMSLLMNFGRNGSWEFFGNCSVHVDNPGYSPDG